MIEQIKIGDKLTYIEVSSLASTVINEITIDDIREDKLIFSRKRKQYCFKPNDGTLILKGHNLGIIRGSWGENGGSCFLMDANCNIGGLDRESMVTLLKTNINPLFNEWNRIHWFDGTSDVGDPLFVPRPRSNNYLSHQKEADGNNSKLASDYIIGEFIHTLLKGSKHNHLMDMLDFHLNPAFTSDEHISLGKVVDIIEMSDGEFSALKYSTNGTIVKDRGGNFSDDIADDRNFSNLSSFEMGTIYTHVTLIRTPSGRAITVDAQGHDYMRYTGLLSHYRESMAEDCAKALKVINSAQDKKAQEQLAQEQQIAIDLKKEGERITKEFSYLTVVDGTYDYTTAAKNLRLVLKEKFPTVKFSVRKSYSDQYTVIWEDGQTVKTVTDITNMFIGRYHSGMVANNDTVCEVFQRKYGFFGTINTVREISISAKKSVLDEINKELGKNYTEKDYVSERIERMCDLVSQRVSETDFSPKVEEQTVVPIAEVAVNSEDLKIVDYSEKSFVIIGDTKPIKEKLKELGGRFNSRLTCGAGWVFSKTRTEIVKLALSIE